MKHPRSTLSLVAVVILVIAATATLLANGESGLAAGERVTVVFTKDAWVRCLAHPESEGLLVEVKSDGLVVQESTENIFSVTRYPIGKAQCQSEGIVEVDASAKRFFVPFRTIAKVLSGNKVVWQSKNATSQETPSK